MSYLIHKDFLKARAQTSNEFSFVQIAWNACTKELIEIQEAILLEWNRVLCIQRRKAKNASR